jgi:hypothetical protein
VDPALPHPREMLARIGHKHASLGIVAEQYRVVHEHLFAAIVEVLGTETVTAEIAAAWDRVYWLMADTLIEFERALYKGAGAEPGDVFRETVVTERIDDLSGAVTFVVEAADPADPLPDFIPGQYVSVGATLPDGARQLRQYSLVHAPRDGRLAFTVRPVAATADQPAGEVSNWLTTHVRWAKRRPRAVVRTAIRRQPDRRPHRLRARPAGGGRYLPVRRGRVPAVGTRTADSRGSSAHASALRTVQPRRLVAATRYRSIRDGCPLPR